MAKGLLKEYNSKYKPDTLVKNLDKLYGYIRSAEHVNSAELTEAATSIAKSILNQSEHLDTELTQQYKDVRKQIKDTKITLSEQDKADICLLYTSQADMDPHTPRPQDSRHTITISASWEIKPLISMTAYTSST